MDFQMIFCSKIVWLGWVMWIDFRLS